MKRLFILTTILIISLGVITNSAEATLQSDTVWEVRTTGSDDNGGGYDFGGTGTDYSQQDAAQLTLTDLATSGIGVTTLTSATGGFTSVMVDNIIQIKSGTNVTAGFYEITAYTDTNTVTLDRAPDDGVGGISGGTGSVGGALLTITKATNVAAVSNNAIHIKSGTYAERVIFNSGKDNLVLIGYNTARLDNPTGTNRPYINASGLTYGLDVVSGSGGHRVMNLRIANATSHGIYCPGNISYGWNLKSSNNGADGIYNSLQLLFFSEASGNSSEGQNSTGNYASHYCYFNNFSDNSSKGADYKYNYGNYIVHSLFEGNSDNGFSSGAEPGIFVHNVAFNNTGANTDGMFFGQGNSESYLEPPTVVNCAAEDNGQSDFDTAVDTIGLFAAFLHNAGTRNNNLEDSDSPLWLGNTTTDMGMVTEGAIGSGSSVLSAGLDLSTLSGAALDYEVNIGLDQDDNAAGGGGETAHTFIGN